MLGEESPVVASNGWRQKQRKALGLDVISIEGLGLTILAGGVEVEGLC